MGPTSCDGCFFGALAREQRSSAGRRRRQRHDLQVLCCGHISRSRPPHPTEKHML